MSGETVQLLNTTMPNQTDHSLPSFFFFCSTESLRICALDPLQSLALEQLTRTPSHPFPFSILFLLRLLGLALCKVARQRSLDFPAPGSYKFTNSTENVSSKPLDSLARSLVSFPPGSLASFSHRAASLAESAQLLSRRSHQSHTPGSWSLKG